jgi:CRP-like cAMP-binding protein
MPQLDGYGVLNIVHNNPNLRNTPFIFLSAKADKSDFRKGMQLGADDYIPKPFDTTDLLDAVDRRLKKAELLKQDIAAGLTGLHNLQGLTSDKEAISSFTLARHIDKYKKKQRIYTEGNHPSSLYYIQKGKVKHFKTNEDGKELVVSLHSEGDFFGYIALLEGERYKVSAEAIEDSEIAVIPKQEFEELINSNPEVAKKFIRLLASNVTEKEQQLLNIAYNSLRKKVADALVSFYDKFQKKDGESFVIDISRENLASVAGTATESLIRTLSDFKNEKLIDIKDGNIVILDSSKLKKLIN